MDHLAGLPQLPLTAGDMGSQANIASLLKNRVKSTNFISLSLQPYKIIFEKYSKNFVWILEIK